MGNEQSSGLSAGQAEATFRKDLAAIKEAAKQKYLREHAAKKAAANHAAGSPQTAPPVSEASSQTSPDDDVLSAFQPRKQPLQQRANNVTTTASSESPRSSSGNETTLQNGWAGNPAEKGVAKKKTSLQAKERTGSTAIPFNPPSGPKSMETGVIRNKTIGQAKEGSNSARPPASSGQGALNGAQKRPATGLSAFADERRPSSSNLPKIAKKTSNASPQSPQRNGAQRPAAATNSSSERQATTSSAIKEERRPTLSDLPKIAKRTSVASPQSPPQDEPTAGTGTPPERPPKWYADLKVKNVRDKNFSNADTLLGRFSDDIRKCRAAGSGNRVPIFDKIRELLHIIVFVEVTADLLKAKHMLENNGALAKMFDDQRSDGVNWPFDIKADARELYNKWCDRVFETDLLRGIKFHVKSVNDKKEGQKTTDSLDRTYPTTRSNYHGNGKLLNGQWWPLQICALRDGAHGSSQAGIHGRNDDCAYSVIMSGGTDSTGKKYPDVDDGDEVLYCGTDSVNGKIAEATGHLIRSAEKKKPVRLLRSSNLGSQYAPEAGFRYDGLYDVVSFENLDGPESMRQRHQFKLKRQAGQDPIRALGPERRLTQQELDEYKKHKRLAGKIKGQV